MTPKSLIKEFDNDHGDEFYKLSSPKNMYTLYQDSESYISNNYNSYRKNSTSNNFEMNSFSLNKNNEQEDILVYENKLEKFLLLSPLTEEEKNEKNILQILLDNVVHHFLINLDSFDSIDIKNSKNVSDVKCIGFDDYKPNNKKIIILDGYTQFIGIKY